MSRLERFFAAIRFSEVKAKASAVHCVQMLSGPSGLSIFIIYAAGKGRIFVAPERCPSLCGKGRSDKILPEVGERERLVDCFYRIIITGGVAVH
jgi:hypothetical protein